MRAIFNKELGSYFGTWLAWGIAAAFSLISALFLFFFDNDFNIFEIGAASLQSYFVLVPWLLLFIIPALTMRSIAEEQQNGTLSWLFAQPVTALEIVLAKFFAVCVVGLVCLLPSFVYVWTVSALGMPAGNIDLGATIGSYIGTALLLTAFAAVGVLASALATNQVMAYLMGIVFSFLMYFGLEQLASYKLLGAADYLLSNLGFYKHFLAFTRGLIDTRDVFYFLTVTALALWGSTLIILRKK